MTQSNTILVLPLLLSLSLVLPLTHATTVKYCGKRAYDVKVEKVQITPDPVQRGKPATFSLSATTDEALYGGILEVGVTYFGIHVHSETHDLCDETTCPVSVGDFVISHTQTLPGFTPPGQYTITMNLYDGKKHLLSCINFDFKIGFGSSVADS